MDCGGKCFLFFRKALPAAVFCVGGRTVFPCCEILNKCVIIRVLSTVVTIEK